MVLKELGDVRSSPQYNMENSKNLTSDKYYTSSYKDINIAHMIHQAEVLTK